MTRILALLLSFFSLAASAQVIMVPIGATTAAPTTATNVTTAGQYADAVSIKRAFDSTAAVRATTTTNSVNIKRNTDSSAVFSTRTRQNSADIAQLKSQTAATGSTSPYTMAVQGQRNIGGTTQYEPDGGSLINATNTAQPGRSLLGYLTTIPVSATLNGISFAVTNAASFSAASSGIAAVIRYSGGTYTKVADVAVPSSTYTSTGWKNIAFASPVSVTSGTYYLALGYNTDNQTAAPQLLSFVPRSGVAEVINQPPGSSTYLTILRIDPTAVPATMTQSDISGSSNTRIYLRVY